MLSNGELILPSLLSADMMCLGEEVAAVMDAGVSMVHLDIMDNHYVPNLTYGPELARSLHRRFPTLKLDVHLMVTPVDDLIKQFANAGAARITIHPEATLHLDRSLQLIRELGCQAGLVLNPATSPEVIEWCLHRLDFVLVMTVNPGFGGQKLIPEVLEKLKFLKNNYPDLLRCVDGGVHPSNISTLCIHGAEQFVVGSALFGQPDYAKTIHTLRSNINLHR